jgi:monofunctional biosynthetic peptidoglycan transglycosylase
MARRRGVSGRILRGLGALFALAVAAVLGLQCWYLGHIVWWKYREPASTAFMRAQLASLQAQDPRATLQHQWVPYARISPHLKRAVIAAEDARFVEHDGVDWDAIEAAHARNQRRGRITHGASTITMQLARNLFLSGERSYVRKAQEVVIAFMLEAVLTKDRILELYLNVAEWGVGVFGCEAAARRYYGSAAAQLGPAQSARLAAMLPRPRFYDRNPGSAQLAARAAAIQRWMGSVGTP